MISNANSLTSRYKTNLVGGFTIESRYNIAPGQFVPVVTRTGIEWMRWGLVPQWAKNLNTGYSMFNAMAETLLEKRSYSALIKSSRCIIPASGFYEWIATDEGEKLPVYFRPDGDELFSLGGIFTTRVDAEGGELKSFTIVTTPPNKTVIDVHDRMPLILSPDEESSWLNPDTDLNDVLLMLNPYEDEFMTSYRVGTGVNNAKNDDKQLILPIEDQTA